VEAIVMMIRDLDAAFIDQLLRARTLEFRVVALRQSCGECSRIPDSSFVALRGTGDAPSSRTTQCLILERSEPGRSMDRRFGASFSHAFYYSAGFLECAYSVFVQGGFPLLHPCFSMNFRRYRSRMREAMPPDGNRTGTELESV
jgi:hypothetical protein